MNIKLIAGLILFGWFSTSFSDVGEMEVLDSNDFEETKLDPEYEAVCGEMRERSPSMTDEDYASFLYYFQETECAHIFQLGDIGFSGGRVFHISNGGRHGLETSPVHIQPLEWGCVKVPVKDARGVYIGAGRGNTEAVIAKGCDSYYGGITAFEAISDYTAAGFSDWYIPSASELHRVFDILGVQEASENISSTPFPRYRKYFWSSSDANERKNSKSFGMNLTTGSKLRADRALRFSVLPIRNF